MVEVFNSVSVTELAQNCSKYINDISEKKEIIIIKHNKPQAILVDYDFYINKYIKPINDISGGNKNEI